jgi:hypothetical protein
LRYEIELRNSFEHEVTNIYKKFLLSTADLIDMLEKKDTFYQKRLEELENELNTLNKLKEKE